MKLAREVEVTPRGVWGLTSDPPHLSEPQQLFVVLPEVAWVFLTLLLHFSAFPLLVPTPGNPFRGQQFGFSASPVRPSGTVALSVP